MDLTIVGLWYVCGFGLATFAAATPLRWSYAGLFALAWAGTSWLAGPDVLPTLPFAGVLTAAGAGFQLIRGNSPRVSAVLAGGLAGIWTGVLEIQGVPPLLSFFVALALPAAAAVLATRKGFAPDTLRDEALLFVSVLATFAAAAPAVHDGWRAALNLNLQDTGPVAVMLPFWTVALSAMAATCGGLYSLWSRR